MLNQWRYHMYRMRLESVSKIAVILCVAIFTITLIVYMNPSDDSRSHKIVKINILEKVSRSSPSLLLVLILSSPSHHLERDAVRDTWLRDLAALNVTALFVVGTAGLETEQVRVLMTESEERGDVLLLDGVRDGYRMLTTKLIEALLWVHNVAKLKYSFLFKGDDDTFVKLRQMCEELTRRRESRTAGLRLYWGFFDGRARVKRSGPWAESDWFMCDRYLPHARGGGYVISYDLSEYIVRNSDLLQRYSSEDISLGAWLAPLKITRIHDVRFDTEYISRGCNNSYLVTHKQDVDQMLKKHERLLRAGRLCDVETVVRPGYEYNWNVAPSQCCPRANSSTVSS